MTRHASSGLQTHLVIAEDNEAVIKIIKKCRSVALRHLPRTHKIDVTWLFEVCDAPEIQLRYVKTDCQIADLMTKGFQSPDKWSSLLDKAQFFSGPTLPPSKRVKPAALAALVGRLYPGVQTCDECGFSWLPPQAACPCIWS